MKEDQSEIRVKLHITTTNSSNVKNLWMCLNYDQKPTISHIIEHIKRNYCSSALDECSNSSVYSFTNEQNMIDMASVKLYLDEYWLPPCENSRLIREGDCVKVEINNQTQDESITSIKKMAESNSQKLTDMNQQNNYYTGKNLMDQNQMAAAAAYYNNYNYDEYYYNYYNHNENQVQQPAAPKSTNKSKSEETSKKTTAKETKTVSQQPSKKQNNAQAVASNKSYKKFAVGGLINLLKEEQEKKSAENNKKKSSKGGNKNKKSDNLDQDSDGVSEEQLIDDYYHSLKHTSPNKQQQNNKQQKNKSNEKKPSQQQQVASGTVDVDKIAANLKSTGTLKWKNSTKQTTSNGPKHIIFPSSSESNTSSSSGSSSSSSTESDDENSSKHLNEQNKQNKKQSNLNKKQEIKTTQEPKIQNKYYEPTKEEQLNAVSSTRSFQIENTKDLANFKKVFNQTKLNAPNPEEFKNKYTAHETNNKDVDSQNLDTSTSSNTSSSTSTTTSMTSCDVNDDNKTKSKKRSKKRSPSPQIDYDSFEPLKGQPRLNDRIAFQVLEISSNFTPEISKYKTGTVIEFDTSSNEITLRLNSKYNAVLKKPSKFSVVFDENEEQKTSSSDETQTVTEEDNILKIDWRNLMNVKFMPKEPLPIQNPFTGLAQNQGLINVK